MRREIHEGLNVVENWNGANAFIFYGKNGEIATNQLAEQELSVLSLHLLQTCLVYVKTLMIQEVLAKAGATQKSFILVLVSDWTQWHSSHIIQGYELAIKSSGAYGPRVGGGRYPSIAARSASVGA